MASRKSTLADGTHPVWLVIRQLVVMVPLCFMLACSYDNGWSEKDLATIAVVATALGVFDGAKKLLVKPEKP